MRLAGSRAYYRPSPPKMPPGLLELMEGLTKEVLKHNPNDIYEFCAGHVQQLLEKRDGPSRKKTLSLDEKVSRALEKVRQRAEKRRQEYDKEIIIQKRMSNAENIAVSDDITLKVPQITYESKGGTNSLDQITPCTPKDPVHQDQALGNSLEVEISYESGFDTPQNIAVTQSVTESVEKSTKILNNEELSTKGAVEFNDETCENLTVQDSSDMSIHNSIEPNLVNKVMAGDGPDVTLKSMPEVEVSNSTPEPSETLPNDIAETVKDGFETITENPSGEDLSQMIASDIAISSQNDVSQDSNETEKVKTVENPSTEYYNNLEVSNQDNGKIKLIHSSNIENTQLSNQVEESLSQNNIESMVQVNNINSEHVEQPQVKDDDKSPQLDNKTEMEASNGLDDNQVISHPNEHKQDNTENKHVSDIKDQHISETQDLTTKDSVLETEMELPAEGIDRDISTLVTESEVDSKSASLNIKNAAPLSDDFRPDKPNIEYETVASISDHLQDQNEINTIDNYEDSSKSAKSIENIQNENPDTSNMDLETAAVTIQKVFRNFLFKSRGSTFEDPPNDEGLDEDDKNKEECDFAIASALNIDRRAHGLTRMDTVLQTVNEEKSLSLSTDDSSTLSSAATIIQAHVRGFLVRNKLNSNKTVSTNSLAASHSNEPSITSLEADNEQNRNKTVLNIHIVPEGENYLSRDESLITSMDLSLDSSPPSSINLHPLGYDKSERRKQLKREDAIQSISPPSNNSGKLSEDFDSVKELSLNDHDVTENNIEDDKYLGKEDLENGPSDAIIVLKTNEEGAVTIKNINDDSESYLKKKRQSLTKMSSDEMDVVTPYMSNEDTASAKLLHSGEFHDAVLPTRVSRSDTSVVSGE